MNTPLGRQAEQAAAFVGSVWPDFRAAARSELGAMAKRPSSVVLCGCGDSHHASSSLSHAFRIWTDLSAQGLPAMQTARYLVPEIDHDPAELLLIGISASGETARTLEALELARQRGLRTVAITCQPASSLAKLADHTLAARLPDQAAGPGLTSYLASLLAGYALAAHLAGERIFQVVDHAIGGLADLLNAQLASEWPRGAAAAERIGEGLPIVFLGSGPAYGSAMFAAAKVLEAAGRPAWAQFAEEWAHLEYFAVPAELPVWLLSASGRAGSRELEVEQAADRIGRQLFVSRWSGGTGWPAWVRETLAPLVLWVGPVALADSLMTRTGETPYRGFAGGRSSAEGGGANRVRSSHRIFSLKEFDEFQPGN